MNENLAGKTHLIGQPKVIVGNDQLRAEKCLAEIQQVLGRYDCEMHPEVTIGAGQIRANVRIVPKPRGVKQ